MNLLDLESELKKLPTLPPWGRKQSDDWDKDSNFVYQLPTYEALQMRLKQLQKGVAFENYVLNRWYNTLSARGVEHIFSQIEGVRINPNRYDKKVDFFIHNLPFDHKTTIFPKNYTPKIEEAQKNPAHLAQWLYQNQSQQGRFHLANRLFVVLYQKDGAHWQLRRELSYLKPHIETYIQNFHPQKLIRLPLADKIEPTLCDLIFVIK
ncbi:hypothetical protein [Hugenholtzia roseola]|uniref:hypothetical protein n=1 Tax=Hugenholtzia roseola TaxID=1002 RepID=UPI0003FB475B|nr:hypothetical protein [Hugenholtzia roseola]